ECGALEGRDPHPLFSTSWYLAQNPEVAGVNPLEHYVRWGCHHGRSPHPLFDCAWYLEQNPDVASAGMDPVQHYLKFGARAGRDPHPLFDSSWYLEQNPALASDINPLQHYLECGALEGRDPHPLFDSGWYMRQDPPLKAGEVNPLQHYVLQGADEGRSPHPLFDSDYSRILKLRCSHATERSQQPLDTVPVRWGIDFQGTMENPGDEVTNEYGLLLVTGWLYLRMKNVAALSARLNGEVEARLAHSLPRADVARHLPQFPSARESGFEGYVPIGMGFSGRSRLEVEAVLTDGTRMRCLQREVIIKLPDPPRRREPPQELSEEDRYTQWIRTNQLTPYLLKKMTRDASRIAQTGPQISIVVPTFNTPARYLEALIESVRGQLYPNWQLCLADDASTEPHVRSILEKAAAADSRVEFFIRPANGHIVKASNSALDLAKGDYVGLLDHDDLLTPDALLHVAEAIVSERGLDVLYTDEDKLSPGGKRYAPIFKGSFSPEMSLTHNYIQHFTVIRKSLLQEVGGFREGFEGAQDLDLYLRVLEKTTPERARHLPFVCYHWRSHSGSTASTGAQKNYVFESARRSIEEALTRRGIRATPFLPDWAKQANCCLYQLRWSPELLRENPVTIVIPTKNRGDLLEKCIASIVRTVDPARVKLIVVDDFSDDEATRRYLRELGSRKDLACEVIRPTSRLGEFNFSHLVNTGVAHATTPLVLLLNNDTEALSPGWLEEMVGWMSIDGVGAVGAKLLYPDGTIQHAGVLVGSHGGLAEHLFHRLDKDIIGFNFLTHAARNVSAVTAACMLTSKAVFNEIKGFDETNLGMEYNDIDYCLRLGRVGKRVVFTPQATLLHRCAQSRREGWRPKEHLSFLRRYQGIKDPYYNENLDLNRMPVVVNPNHFVHKDRVGKLKVLMISHNLNLEGAPKVLFDHAAYFASSGGYDVTMVSLEDGLLRGQVEEAGILVRIVEGVLPRPGENTLDYTERLREIGANLEAKSYDLVVCSTLTSFWGVVLAGLFNLPAIWHIHESATLDQFFHFDPVPEGLVESCLAAADRVVFQADATRKLFTHYEKRGNFKTISGAIDVGAIDRFREQHSQRSLKVKHGIDPDKIVVSLIGTTCPRKGQLIFIQAIELLQTRWPNDIAKVCFVMLGACESPYLHLLRMQLETIRETDTHLIEPRHDVFDFYRLTDIFVCASFQESFPRVILESMAFKLPIVTTDVFGIPEILEKNHEEALLVHAGDPLHMARCIKNLVRDPKAREELGAKAHAKVTRLFNSRTHLGRQLDLTKEVVARHG
ncbi:MAG: glycosyltransferase, partial [Chthoniobacterales bacterium]